MVVALFKKHRGKIGSRSISTLLKKTGKADIGRDRVMAIMKEELTKWIVKYNHIRPHSALGNQSPVEFERGIGQPS